MTGAGVLAKYSGSPRCLQAHCLEFTGPEQKRNHPAKQRSVKWPCVISSYTSVVAGTFWRSMILSRKVKPCGKYDVTEDGEVGNLKVSIKVTKELIKCQDPILPSSRSSWKHKKINTGSVKKEVTTLQWERTVAFKIPHLPPPKNHTALKMALVILVRFVSSGGGNME